MSELEQPEVPRYSTILFDVRKKLEISINEYVLLDMVYKLSFKTGYCFKSPRLIADDLGLKKRATNYMISRLIERGLLERLTPQTMRVTDNYIREINSGQKLPSKEPQGGQKTHTGGQKLHQVGNKSTNNRGDNNNIDIQLDSNTNVLGAVRLGSSEINEIFDFWEEQVGYKIESRVKANRFACSNLLKKHGRDKLKQLIKGVALAQNNQYAPRISDFSQLQQKLNDLMVWGKQRHSEEQEATLAL
jgi:hypothetical protein